MLEKHFVAQFASDWVEAWNHHDLDRVLIHYADDFEMASPLIAPITGDTSGRLRGKLAVRAYWTKALELIPNLRFELKAVLVGTDSVVIHYHSPRGLAAEFFRFDNDGKVAQASAHYDSPYADVRSENS